MNGQKKYIYGLTKAFLVKMFSFLCGGQKWRKKAEQTQSKEARNQKRY